MVRTRSTDSDYAPACRAPAGFGNHGRRREKRKRRRFLQPFRARQNKADPIYSRVVVVARGLKPRQQTTKQLPRGEGRALPFPNRWDKNRAFSVCYILPPHAQVSAGGSRRVSGSRLSLTDDQLRWGAPTSRIVDAPPPYRVQSAAICVAAPTTFAMICMHRGGERDAPLQLGTKSRPRRHRGTPCGLCSVSALTEAATVACASCRLHCCRQCLRRVSYSRT